MYGPPPAGKVLVTSADKTTVIHHPRGPHLVLGTLLFPRHIAVPRRVADPNFSLTAYQYQKWRR